MKTFYPSLVSKRQINLQLIALFMCFFVKAGVNFGYNSPVLFNELPKLNSDYATNPNNTAEKGSIKLLDFDFATSSAPGGPILIIGSSSSPFSSYPAEILLAEGLNQFSNADIADLSTALIESYGIIVLGEVPLTNAQVTILTEWTQAGGILIALRPDLNLAPLLGLNPAGGTLEDKYILINTSTGPGKGLVNQTIQYHSAADLYTLNGATSLATLYSGANTSTIYPAVSINNVGTNGGKAVAFAYDLARSIVYTRQGNPAWAGQERDGQPGPIRANDMFFPDWIDLNKVAIPQADEQQRLLANIIIHNSLQPVPRFWYLPRGLKAAVVMTGDDHASGGTKARFNQYLQLSEDNSAEAIRDWRAIRSTSYIYPNTPITDAEAKNYEDQGFEIALHLNTNCENYTPLSLGQHLDSQLAELKSRFPSLSSPMTNRTHCIAFSDWATQPKLETERGIRMDANYYYWPGSWVQNRPGMFTGSSFPMRFADLDGSIIETYQLVTQMTDESEQTFPYTIDQLLNKALGPEGYYGVFTANMHTDVGFSDGSDKIIASAKSLNVPVISAKQLLTWIDGRNGSSFDNMVWNGSQLDFTVSAAVGAFNLEGMLPINSGPNTLSVISHNGSPVSYRAEIIKGINYAIFPAKSGQYLATYDFNELPEIIITSPQNAAEFSAPANITIEASALDLDGTIVKVEFFNGGTRIGEDLTSPYSFNWTNVEAGTYSLTATAIDDKGGVSTSTAINITVNVECPCSVFKSEDKPATSLFQENGGIQLGMKFRTTIDGFVNGVRFYKQAGHAGTNIGQLYTATGSLLAQVTFSNETASGWQEALFSNPVPVSSNTTYIISYHSSNGYYSANTPNFSSSIENGPLKALADEEDGPNGIYLMSNTPGFPTSTYQGGNYWVDVVFGSEYFPGNTPPAVSLISPENNMTFTAPADINLEASATDADGTIEKVEFFNGTTKLGEDLDGSNGWQFNWNAVPAGLYTVTARATDNEGAVATSEAITILVDTNPENVVCPCTVFDPKEAPISNVFHEGQGLQLGMKLRTSIDGYITGVRFYKNQGHLGTNIGQLYSNSGILLAQATFVEETESGWQEVSFATPVAINANTTYIISYHSSDGYYSANNPDFSESKVNGPIKGLANGEDGPNGVYLLSDTPGFPVNNFAATNYWVDAVFTKENTAVNEAPAVAITSPENNSTFTSLANIIITASASDTDGTVTKVEFFSGTTKLGEDIDGNDGWSYDWNNVPSGNYAITAMATDDKAAVSTSEVVNIVVSDPANAAPSVAIISPENNSTFTSPANITITASASDTDGIVTKVEFFSGTTKLGEDLDGNDGWSYDWNNVASGNYAITAIATDDKAAVSTSEVINIVVDSIPAPEISSFSPGTGPVGTLVTILGQNLASASRVTFGPSAATIVSNTDTQIEVLVPSVNGKLPSNVKITVTTSGGNYTHPDKFTITAGTAPANTPPSVSLTAPVNGATFEAPASINLTATASDPDGSVVKVEFYSGATRLGEDLESPYEYSWNNVPAGTYSLSARATDDKGAITNSVSVSVSVTDPNNSAPIVSIISPANNEVFIAPASVNISASASDPDGTISKVEFFEGATKLIEFVTAPFDYTWTNVAEGNYLITVRATDNLGAVTSASLNISVNPASIINEPSNLTAQWVSNSQVNLTWLDNSNDETGFVLERATKSDFSGKVDLINLPENAVSYQDQNLNNKKGGGVLFYRIKAISGNLFSLYSNVAQASPISAGDTKESETITKGSITDVESDSQVITEDRLVVSPNPTSGMATIQFILQQSANYSLSLYNTNGALIYSLGSGYTEPGVLNSREFDGTNLADGLYIVRLEYNNSILTFRLLLSK